MTSSKERTDTRGRKTGGGNTMHLRRTITADLVRSALASVPSDVDRDTWVHVGMAIKSELGADAGFDLWSEWSALGESYKPRDARDAWRSMKAGDRTTIGALFGIAKDHGWQFQDADAASQASAVEPANPAELQRVADERRQQREAEAAEYRRRADQAARAGRRCAVPARWHAVGADAQCHWRAAERAAHRAREARQRIAVKAVAAGRSEVRPVAPAGRAESARRLCCWSKALPPARRCTRPAGQATAVAFDARQPGARGFEPCVSSCRPRRCWRSPTPSRNPLSLKGSGHSNLCDRSASRTWDFAGSMDEVVVVLLRRET
ncbi:PriCT-2 domain-containing protein [Aquabacterium sp.]|uniref:PriCT-2 domain-containing protein n=1 Tax=Aquabacterium sp. TaxID=1872578 RepID=UPI0037832083